ncbi:FadR family transcriptional regulator [Inquilinus limosus]|uniref:FadR/GntR family transcriptional regulator n=1 Tax=Inquilinus limosus TaxID=171674 RepID=UPI003F172C6E
MSAHQDAVTAVPAQRRKEQERRPAARTGAADQRQGSKTFSRRSLHGQIAYDIGVRIVRGDIPPGTVLPNESDLSTQFSVSRTALREAIKVLAAKGLVESRPKTGTRVRPRSEWNMLDPDLLAWQFATQPMERLAKDLFEIRQIIEPAAAAMAAERGDDGQREAISRAFADMEAAPDGDASVEPDLRFHQSILAASNNEFLQPLGALIETAMASSFRITNNAPGALQVSLPLHRAVRDAILAREPETARKAMRVLLEDAAQDMRRALPHIEPNS